MTARQPTPGDRDEHVALPLDPEIALRALLQVDPDAQPVDEGDGDDEPGQSGRR